MYFIIYIGFRSSQWSLLQTSNIFTLSIQDPVPPKPWIGIWNASLPGSMCLQYNRPIPFTDVQDPIVGEEDCLFINVYTPKVIKNSNTIYEALLNPLKPEVHLSNVNNFNSHLTGNAIRLLNTGQPVNAVQGNNRLFWESNKTHENNLWKKWSLLMFKYVVHIITTVLWVRRNYECNFMCILSYRFQSKI